MTSDQAGLLAITGVVSFGLSYAGAAVGLILGHLRLPLFVYTLGSAVGGATTNLAVSGVGALAGSFRHTSDGHISRPLLLLMGVPSVIGAVVAILLFTSVSPFWSHLVIGVMLVQAGLSLIRSRKDAGTKLDSSPLSQRRRLLYEVLIGLALGMLCGVTGLMLGTLRLPMMIRYLGIDPKVAVGTNMLIGCLTALTAAITAWANPNSGLDLLAVLIVGPPTVLGSYLGAKQTARVSKETLKGWVGATVAFSGLFMIGEATESKLHRKQRVHRVRAPIPALVEPAVIPPHPFMVEELPDLPIMNREIEPDEDDPIPDPEE